MSAVTSLVLLLALHLRKCKGAALCSCYRYRAAIELQTKCCRAILHGPVGTMHCLLSIYLLRYVTVLFRVIDHANILMIHADIVMHVCVYMCVRFMLDKANYSFIINKQQTIVIQTWALSNSFDFGPLSWLVERTILMCADTLRYIHICTYAWMYVHTFMAHKVNCGRHMHMHVCTYVHICVFLADAHMYTT